MKALRTRDKMCLATVGLLLLIAVFLAGARHGYDLGYAEGEKRTNGWWIDKKAHYYESGEIRKKRFSRKLNQI